MTPSTSPLSGARVVVVTTSLESGTNDLWEAARDGVGSLTVVGARRTATGPLRPGEVGLRELDAGRGLIWRHLVGLRSQLKRHPPDLVHVNGELWGITAQQLVGLPVPVVVHGAENLWHHGNPVEERVRLRLIDRAVDRIAGYASWNHAGAAHVAEQARRLGRADLPTLVFPGIIPPAPFVAASWAPPAGADEPFRILMVGRVIPEKGFHHVLRAAAELTGRAALTLCGEGTDVPRLRSMAAELDVDLEVLGWLSAEELAPVMARSHVMVQPSLVARGWAEQFGRTVAEAMTVGLPCVVSDSGELPHLVGEDRDALFPPGDVATLVSRLRRLTDDRAALDDLSVRQRSLADRWSRSSARQQMTAFWAAALAGR